MRPPFLRAQLDQNELVVDSFAGGGGASTGIEAALGRPVDIAINHDAEAIAMHTANHPETRHYREDIWEVDPREACGSNPVGLAWFSPDCTHFSRAKGTQPRKQGIRSLAWVVIRWAKAVRPRMIVLENVEEFQTWGPLDENGRPRATQIGRTFRAWLSKLASLGYAIEYRSLVAADYGTPTIRRRLFLVARRDDAPIIWPDATHGKGRAVQWRAASEIIDWSLPCASIFGRKKPLAEATLRRIVAGIRRYVVDAATPFIVPLTHAGDARVHGIDEPVRTITAAHRGELALVNPFVVRHGHYSTITGAALREGCGAGTFRGQPLHAPLGTVCATNDKHLVAPIVTKHYGGVVGHEVTRPIGAVTARDHHALTTAHLSRDACDRHSDVRALLRHYGEAELFDSSIVRIGGEQYRIVDLKMRMLQPRELFAAQGFPSDYEIAPHYNGKPLTKTAQTRLAGNAVNPQIAEAIVSANVLANVRAA